MEQKSTQDYLKAVYDLSKNGDLVSTTEISQKLDVAPASVTEMLKKLSQDGYIKYSPYHGSTLTEKGLQEAQKVTRKHRLLEKFLSDVLHIGKDKVHTQACQMEHALSDEAEESLCRLLKHPDTCSDDGKTIPACDLPFSNCEECVKLHNQGLEEVGKRNTNLISIRELKGRQIRQNQLHPRRTQSSPTAFRHGANTWNKNKSNQSCTNGRTQLKCRFEVQNWHWDKTSPANVFVEVEQPE